MYDCDIEVKSNSACHILGVGQINCKIRSSKPIHSLGESELSEDIEKGLKQTLKHKVEKSLKDIFAKLKSLDSAEEIKRTELNAMLEEFLLTQESLPSSPVIRIAAEIGGTSVRAIVDTGASRSHVSQDIYLKMKAENPAWIKDLADKYNLTIKGASGVCNHPELKAFKAKVKLPSSEMALEETFVVLPTLPPETTLLGMTYFNESHGLIRGYNRSISFEKYKQTKTNLPVKYTYDANTPLHLLLYTQEDVILDKGKKQVTVRVEAKKGYSDKIVDKFLEGSVRQTIPMMAEHGIFTVNSECQLTERKGSICLRSIDNNEI
jgi:hypothetical protein